MKMGDVGKFMELKIIMAIKAPNGKKLFLYECLDYRYPINKSENINQIKLFMEKNK